MKTKYERINELHRNVNESGRAELLQEIPGLLDSWGIKLRADDGQLIQINITKPENGLLVVGLRYLKKDETFTEDLFEFRSTKPSDISRHYKGKYERERIEYRGTHKQQNISSLPFTSVNTCSFYTSNKNDN
ncbi:MAG: hypothetical protein KZQ95_09520 [Candidatus Thiodiazotropha sp. (ex Epidulcina cf. delphinae)]|nr:hypothetical protein [Candidatus Thiodiazotropha sp. (ex Epidulcina cf. delphinae)]